MQDLCNTLPEYSVVKEMDCIGDTLAPRIIAEIGDVRRFKNKHSLIAYAGIDAPPYQRVHSTLLSVIYPSVETVICEKQATRSCSP